jgi:excisionase family DNA binding protein
VPVGSPDRIGIDEGNAVWRAMNNLLTMDEAAKYLGISKLTLYGWVSARKLGYVKMGRLVKFRQAQLDAWID